MQTFAYMRPSSLADAIEAAVKPATMIVAGGTELLNWMKEGIATPRQLIDINGLSGLGEIEASSSGLRIGALARMSDVAEHEVVRHDYPAISQALLKSASAQVRNMASMGGNIMQRTRCVYFRAEVELPCNKRRPGTGCSALDGEDRGAALFGLSEACIATHPSDVAVAFVALDAVVKVEGPNGARTIPFGNFHRVPDDKPESDTVLGSGEIITAIEVPATALAKRSHYLKVRERASYEFALISVAVALDLDGGAIREVRIALGGVAPKPWRLADAEQALRGSSPVDRPALRRALDDAFAAARPSRYNGFKIEYAKRAVIRALETAESMA